MLEEDSSFVIETYWDCQPRFAVLAEKFDKLVSKVSFPSLDKYNCTKNEV